MTDAEDLLLRILGDPDEDLPRLMYADEIEEANPTRAEFIRVQCELARIEHTAEFSRLCTETEWFSESSAARQRRGQRFDRIDPKTRIGVLHYRGVNPKMMKLHDREQELWEFVACAGVPIGIGSNQITLERGFVKKVEVSAQVWLAHADQLLAAHPVQEVTVSGFPIFPSGGNDTYYVGNSGVFPAKYWSRLDSLPTRFTAVKALRAVLAELWPTVKTWRFPTDPDL